MSNQELELMLTDALDDFDVPTPPLPRCSSPNAARRFATPPSPIPIPLVSRISQSFAPNPTLMAGLVADTPTSTELTLMAEADASPTSALPTPTLMAGLVADPPTSTELTLMAEADASPTSALPTTTLMADLVADLPTSITLTSMTEAGASLLTNQYQVKQRLHSQCHELCTQNGVMMLATQTKAAQAAYHCLSPAELQRRKQQKRRRRARLKQLADQQAAKQMRRRTINGDKQRHTHGDVRKKSAANRRHNAYRTSSWVNSLQGSQLAAM
jgi:hypothetical protein